MIFDRSWEAFLRLLVILHKQGNKASHMKQKYFIRPTGFGFLANRVFLILEHLLTFNQWFADIIIIGQIRGQDITIPIALCRD
jgi:hypothetical protein